MHPKIVILTGSAMSVESGLAGMDELACGQHHRLEAVATSDAFRQNPDKVHQYYNACRAQLLLPHLAPSQGHVALAKFANEMRDHVLLVTQNIDNLLERAGASNVLHMHGDITKIRCINCAKVQNWQGNLSATTQCPSCLASATLRPHIIWHGEIPFGLQHIYTALRHCDIFISIGASGGASGGAPSGVFGTNNIFNASIGQSPGAPASIVHEARKGSCKKMVEINTQSTDVSGFFNDHLYGDISHILPGYLSDLSSEIMVAG